MTDVIMNVENIIENYKDENQEIINPKIDTFFIVYRLKKLIKTEFAQQLIRKNIVNNKEINGGKSTIKGTRVTPNDIGRIVTSTKCVTIEKIFEELPSLETEEQILAGLFVFMKDNITWKKVLLGK